MAKNSFPKGVIAVIHTAPPLTFKTGTLARGVSLNSSLETPLMSYAVAVGSLAELRRLLAEFSQVTLHTRPPSSATPTRRKRPKIES